MAERPKSSEHADRKRWGKSTVQRFDVSNRTGGRLLKPDAGEDEAGSQAGWKKPELFPNVMTHDRAIPMPN